MTLPQLHDECLVEARRVSVQYSRRRAFTSTWSRPAMSMKPARTVTAVRDVDLEIHLGRTLGLIGESGCGKTSLGRALLRLAPLTSGTVRIDDVNVWALGASALRRFRPRMQMIFQDTAGSLNPRMRVQDIVADPLRAHGLSRGSGLSARVRAMLDRVGLPSSTDRRFPHELSGGQRQRVGVARALILAPRFVVCDEPLSALDVAAQAEVLDLLRNIQRDLGLSYLFVTHNLALVRNICDQVAVMYAGRIVETGPTSVVIGGGAHPYTRALRASVPAPVPRRRGGMVVLPGEPPSPTADPVGCPFHPRCSHVTDRCRAERPLLRVCPGSTEEHRVACHHVESLLTGPLTGPGPEKTSPSRRE